MKRAFRSRPPIAVAPLAVSTESCVALVGLPPRKLRELLAAHPDIPRSRVGHTLIVTADDFYALLDRARVVDAETVAPEGQVDRDDDEPRSVDDVLRRLGKERVA